MLTYYTYVLINIQLLRIKNNESKHLETYHKDNT